MIANLHEQRLHGLVATINKVGEGFDETRLDVLDLVTPISWEGSLLQCVGRICRAHPGKKRPVVVDWQDQHGMLEHMADERKQVYAAHGWPMRT